MNQEQNKNPRSLPIGVIGIGNVLMGDDAIGPYIIKTLKAKYDFPENVVLVEAGTPGPDLSNELIGFDAAIVLDAVRMGEASAGTVRRFERNELIGQEAGEQKTPHDPGLREALLLTEFTGEGPLDIVLIGVMPGVVDAVVKLSPEVKAAVPRAVELVLEELVRLGATAQEKASPTEPDVWWE